MKSHPSEANIKIYDNTVNLKFLRPEISPYFEGKSVMNYRRYKYPDSSIKTEIKIKDQNNFLIKNKNSHLFTHK